MTKNKDKKIKYILITIVSLTVLLLSACSQATPELSPMPAINMSKNSIEPPIVSLEVEESESLEILSPIELSDPIENLIDQGSNIENNGMAAISEDTIYFVQDGLNSMSANGYHKKTLIEQDDMICLNVTDDYIYYVSSSDYSVYKVDRSAENIPQNLGIKGAYSMMIIQDHIYYQNAIGEDADNYIYRVDMDGNNPENLMIKASIFCSDGQNIYYSNQEDENRIYSLDTCTGEIEQLSNNQGSQLNIIDGSLYYINKTTKYITKLNVETMESTVVLEEPSTYLNTNGKLLVFYAENKTQLGTMTFDGTDVKYFLEYNDINGLNVTGDWVFFESYNNSYEEETFYIKINGEELSKNLPITAESKIINYDTDQKIIYIDFVEYHVGDDALEEYLKDNSVSERKATEDLEKTNGVYIQNRNPKIIEYKMTDLTQITLYINLDTSNSAEKYSASLATFEEIYLANPDLLLNQVYIITSYEGQMIKLEQILLP